MPTLVLEHIFVTPAIVAGHFAFPCHTLCICFLEPSSLPLSCFCIVAQLCHTLPADSLRNVIPHFPLFLNLAEVSIATRTLEVTKGHSRVLVNVIISRTVLQLHIVIKLWEILEEFITTVRIYIGSQIGDRPVRPQILEALAGLLEIHQDNFKVSAFPQKYE